MHKLHYLRNFFPKDLSPPSLDLFLLVDREIIGLMTRIMVCMRKKYCYNKSYYHHCRAVEFETREGGGGRENNIFKKIHFLVFHNAAKSCSFHFLLLPCSRTLNDTILYIENNWVKTINR